MRNILGLFLAFSIGAGGMYFWKKPKASPREELPGLKEQISQAASRNIPLPSLEIKKIEIRVKNENVEDFIATTLQLAKKMGGKALQGLDRESDKVILATLPEKNLADFITALNETAPKPTKNQTFPTDSELIECEVIIHPF